MKNKDSDIVNIVIGIIIILLYLILKFGIAKKTGL